MKRHNRPLWESIFSLIRSEAWTQAQSKSSFTKPEPGLAITYLLGLNKQVNLNICVAGSLVDFPFKNGNHNQDNEKKLLLEADASVQYRIHTLPPFSVALCQYRSGLFKIQ